MANITAVLIFSLVFIFSAASPGWGAKPHKHGHGSPKGHEAHHPKKHGHHGGGKDVVPCMESAVMIHPEKKSHSKEGKVVILTPKNGAVIKARRVKVKFDISKKGTRGDHLHIYLNGRCLNMVRGNISYSVGGLKPGTNRIDVRLVDKNHIEYGPRDSVEIKVMKGHSKGMSHKH